jgi:asparagine synthase (glutamine-hydrolysing)
MFAFAVYDMTARRLELVRDRLGIKPLYFREDRGAISFGSEVRVLNGGRRPALGDDALATYLMTGHLPGSGEIGSDIRALSAGCRMSVDANGAHRVERWWLGGGRRAETGDLSGSRAEDVRAEVRRLVEDSVQEHLLADVPVASFLSGGTDSSVISLVAARAASQPLRTFSVGFPQKGLDERPIAKLVAERAGARHMELEVTPEDCIRWIVDGVAAMVFASTSG